MLRGNAFHHEEHELGGAEAHEVPHQVKLFQPTTSATLNRRPRAQAVSYSIRLGSSLCCSSWCPYSRIQTFAQSHLLSNQVSQYDPPSRASLLHRQLSNAKATWHHTSPAPSSLADEADDEASMTSVSTVDETNGSLDFQDSDDPPKYPGDDTRQTSRKELAGWYCYGWAAEVFVICGVGKCLRSISPF